MEPTTTIYYHADCLDGFGAAYAAWRKFGDHVCYRPIHHGQPWVAEDIAGRDVFILDFSFPVADLRAMASLARTVFLLDHHATARRFFADQLPDETNGLAAYRDPTWPLTVMFDLGKSGARLAWEHFHAEIPIPLALAHIEDEDLWRFGIPGSRAFCRALRLLPFDFQVWDEVIQATSSATDERYGLMLTQGQAIETFFAREVERLASSRLVTPVTLLGEPIDPLQALRHGQTVVDDGDRVCRAFSGLAINASAIFASELGHVLAQRSGTFSLIWQLAGDGEVKISLRADGQVNVAALAEHYGGGGHPNAAGFRLPASRFFTEILTS